MRALFALALLLALPWSHSLAGSPRFCDQPARLTADQKDKLLRVAAIVKSTLDASAHDMAIVARSGLDLSLVGQRYSHAGFSLKHSANTPWTVRQLYYACDEQRPRIFDQGLSGFMLGYDDADTGYLSVLLLPPAQDAELARAALDDALALRLLGGTYSANAYAFSTLFQNCNQWVVEMLAAAWGRLTQTGGAPVREQAQQWLRANGYSPSIVAVSPRPLAWLASLVPWLHTTDHPRQDVDDALFHVSLPASIESFVSARVPQAERIEFCHDSRRVVVRRGWQAIDDGCLPRDGDTVIPLD